MDLINKVFIKLFAKKVGIDEFGNAYFQNQSGKRFVVYNGMPEPSKVPMEWHGWLHYSTNLAPVKIDTKKSSWQKIHLPNLTGTKNAHLSKKNSLKKASTHYKAWNPEP